MSVFAGLLPGFRELRTPFSVGAAWLCALALLIYPKYGSVQHLDAVRTTTELYRSLPTGARAGVGIAAVYIVGILANGAMSGLVRSQLAQRVGHALGRSGNRWYWRLSRPSLVARTLLEGSIRERLAPISRTLSSFVPTNLVTAEFQLAALRLSKDAPEQFQQYDRLRSEGELRLSISPPLLMILLVFSCRLPLLPACLAAVVGLVLCGLLAYEGVRQQHNADETLAAAIYFDFASTPLLDILVRTAQSELPINRRDAEVQDPAWLLTFLAVRGLRENLNGVMRRLYHPSQNDKYFEVLSCLPRHVVDVIQAEGWPVTAVPELDLK